MIADKHRCSNYFAHYEQRRIFGVPIPLTMGTLVRCEQRNSHCIHDGVRDPNAVHDAAHPTKPDDRIQWTDRVPNP